MTRNSFFKKCILAVLPLIVFFAACHSEKKQAKIETGGVITDEAEELSERDMFFRTKIFPQLRKQNFASAEKMLNEEIKEHPEYQKEPIYFSAMSIINYNKGNYSDAYKDASRIIQVMEQRFSPKKPYQIDFQSDKARESVASHYLYRYQASLKLKRYEAALEDVDMALKIDDKARIRLIKSNLLILLKRYDEAAKEINKAYELDKSVLANEGESFLLDVCTVYYENGYTKVKACKETFKSIEEMQKEAEEAE